MSVQIKIRKGLDINLQGKAEKIYIKSEMAGSYAVKPINFKGITPKLTAKVDSKVKAGSPLFFDKNNPDVYFTSPVSGTVTSINRGERRKILEVVVKPDAQITYEKFDVSDVSGMSREDIVKTLLQSGCWPYIKQRPYDIIAKPEDKPKAIFISAFDSAPLAPDIDFIMKGSESEFQTGITALRKLTDGKIHLNVNGSYPPSPVFSKVKGVQLNTVTGPHPAGNVGVQIHHIDPLNKGETVWHLKPQDVAIIGRLFEKGVYDASKIVALAGSELLKPRYHKIISGANIASITRDNVKNSKNRYISGNTLTGDKIEQDGHIGFYHNLVTVIPEGDYYEFMGWAAPGFNKYSKSRAFWSWLRPDKEYKIDTNMKGGHRAYVVTGQYEQVLPMEIYPVQLIKSILVEDIDLMEKLGIYEVAEEDFALCEFVCTSKTEVQPIIRKGIDLMIKELS
ncbi:MAG: Na(+)-translocating NADH-quinone reductase subunit A [Bacteroidetes bacterium]|jgi:Na+-transporting NADH:ubiquinone oxidoreductase subunit A|nr:Na(+)-translocating NADH-quinone reductase subunit A [Bacteroidota bacterium]